MPIKLIEKPTVVEAAGNVPKKIEEFIGCLNSGTSALSIARMTSPAGWKEPGQTPEFDEYTVVLNGVLGVKTKDTEHEVRAGVARERLAHASVELRLRVGCAPARAGEQVDRVEDLDVARAAAEVHVDGLGDLGPGRRGVLVEQGLGA